MRQYEIKQILAILPQIVIQIDKRAKHALKNTYNLEQLEEDKALVDEILKMSQESYKDAKIKLHALTTLKVKYYPENPLTVEDTWSHIDQPKPAKYDLYSKRMKYSFMDIAR